jgi:hypothetical protein
LATVTLAFGHHGAPFVDRLASTDEFGARGGPNYPRPDPHTPLNRFYRHQRVGVLDGYVPLLDR